MGVGVDGFGADGGKLGDFLNALHREYEVGRANNGFVLQKSRRHAAVDAGLGGFENTVRRIHGKFRTYRHGTGGGHGTAVLFDLQEGEHGVHIVRAHQLILARLQRFFIAFHGFFNSLGLLQIFRGQQSGGGGHFGVLRADGSVFVLNIDGGGHAGGGAGNAAGDAAVGGPVMLFLQQGMIDALGAEFGGGKIFLSLSNHVFEHGHALFQTVQTVISHSFFQRVQLFLALLADDLGIGVDGRGKAVIFAGLPTSFEDAADIGLGAILQTEIFSDQDGLLNIAHAVQTAHRLADAHVVEVQGLFVGTHLFFRALRNQTLAVIQMAVLRPVFGGNNVILGFNGRFLFLLEAGHDTADQQQPPYHEDPSFLQEGGAENTKDAADDQRHAGFIQELIHGRALFVGFVLAIDRIFFAFLAAGAVSRSAHHGGQEGHHSHEQGGREQVKRQVVHQEDHLQQHIDEPGQEESHPGLHD